MESINHMENHMDKVVSKLVKKCFHKVKLIFCLIGFMILVSKPDSFKICFINQFGPLYAAVKGLFINYD